MKNKFTILEKLKYRIFGIMPKKNPEQFRQEQLDSAKKKYRLLSHHINITSQLKKKS